ncbi:hypothetical protein V7G09_04815 [Cutibacterium avidum]|jgi:hypothetical protein|uniref:hypothetical protein n=1 Tax=Cutibacterium avidum TaxID=33010 RepID=UPI00204CB5A8|nr:hypothetical protein [Cutibacterium avidum]MDU5809324.1 hypothetical protein [Finegoldia magna]DAL65406.1 MAG TPA_asm: hypothetical protein [Caudoviricetes sp.]MCO6684749.1 hypothetical protein [Cutibacterium avidum]MCO6688316.1 hypothetical protein [Cutibacterium avidum]MDU5841454.1 hypothetical protein [Cutibacterium avidum]
MLTETDLAVWRWLPARPNRHRRATDTACANALDAPVQRIRESLVRLRRGGYAAWDGPRSTGWHKAATPPEVKLC